MNRMQRVIDVRPGEIKPFLLSFAWFYLLLACYYTLRPVRDALAAGVIGSTDLRWAFLMTFVVMLVLVPVFGWLASTIARRRLVPAVYGLFVLNIFGISFLFDRFGAGEAWLGWGFFVWLSVFNVFVVSVFWSFMADIYHREQARRLFAPIAAGGSLGAMSGPLITSQLVEMIGVARLLWVSAGLLLAALVCVTWLVNHAPRDKLNRAEAMGGSIVAGLELAISEKLLRIMMVFMILGTFTGSLLYLLQADAIGALALDNDERTALFARIDLTINILATILQLFLTGKLLERFGFASMLVLLPIIVVASFVGLTVAPVLGFIIAMQVLRRGTLFGITNPTSHMLFSLMGPQSKYKFKNFLDTAVYRAGDTAGSWMFAGIVLLGGSLAIVSVVGAVAATIWTGSAWWLGRRYKELADKPPTLP